MYYVCVSIFPFLPLITVSPPRTGQYSFIIGSATPVDPQYAEFIVNFDQVPGQSNIENNQAQLASFS